jgi:hypothetical protein
MKILLVNDILTATLSALHVSANYPVENIQSPFLKKIFKSTASADTITALWSADKTIDCIYLAHTNAVTISVKLYDSNNSLLKTISMTSADLGTNFTAITGVRKATIELTATSDPVYIGAIGAGANYSMISPLSDFIPGSVDYSSTTRSSDGQVQINKISPLAQIVFNFITCDYALYETIRALIDAVSQPVFVDPFSLSHTTLAPFYSCIDGGFSNPGRDDRAYIFTLTFTEAR